MCGRFTLKTNLADWVEDLLAEPVVNLPKTTQLAFNIAPSQEIWTVARDAKHRLHCKQMHWGLVPGWSKDRSIGSKMINARQETVLEKPSFKRIIQSRRCLVPADGYYEWAKVDSAKQPYWISRRNHAPFFFAGIWDHNQNLGTSQDKPFLSVSILTTHATESLAHLHERSPLILTAQSQYARWMNEKPFEAEELKLFCVPPLTDEMVAMPVGSRVGNVNNQGPDLIEPIEVN